MFAAQGHHGAPGARAAVLSDGMPATVRRALVLLGLLAGALTASWLLGTASAQAEAVDLTGGAEEQVNGTVGAEAPETPGTEEIGDTADEAVDTAETVSPEVPESGTDVVGQVQETVDGATDEVDERVQDTVPATEPDQEPESGTEAPASEDAESGRGAGEGTEHAEDGTGYQAPRPIADIADTAERDDLFHRTDAVGETAPERSVPADDTAAHAATGTTSATGGSNAGAVTGFLPSTAAPAPAPGPEQAVLAVLRAVPTADADEPTVAPD
ncbi:hypothetical protein [Nocardiopsis xinjiangensis]|uniref:hypothetical protein n=1 Tax=Nocardiopsis xinjiangensis TaxID=124285 RepID=UPI00034947E1|nr:hypothetical protein [Nocardiopsis xinjiangensis]